MYDYITETNLIESDTPKLTLQGTSASIGSFESKGRYKHLAMRNAMVNSSIKLSVELPTTSSVDDDEMLKKRRNFAPGKARFSQSTERNVEQRKGSGWYHSISKRIL